MAENENGNRRPTERVVLRCERVLVLPDGTTAEQLEEAAKALKLRGKPVTDEAWIEVGRHVAATKTAAIEAHAGKPGTPDAKVGLYRAPSSTAWKGAVSYSAPPLPLVQRQVIE